MHLEGIAIFANMFLVTNENMVLCLYIFKLIFLWYDIWGKKGSLQRKGMAAIPKTVLSDCSSQSEKITHKGAQLRKRFQTSFYLSYSSLTN